MSTKITNISIPLQKKLKSSKSKYLHESEIDEDTKDIINAFVKVTNAMKNDPELFLK